MTHRRAVVALVSLCFVAGLAAASPSYAQVDECTELPASTATINGSVKDQDTSAPVFGTVTASADIAGFGPQSFSGATNFLDGTFSIQVVAPATYTIQATPLDFMHAAELFDGVLTKAAAIEIAVTEGQVVNGINFTVVTGGTISGTVTEEDGGEPIEGVIVQALSLGDLFQISVTNTDSSGEYTLQGLAPISYQVSFFPDQSSEDYLIEVYDNRGTFPGDPVNVTLPGVTGIDAEIARGGRIEGTVSAVGGGPLESVGVVALGDGTYAFGSDQTAANGSYALIVASGTYNVFASANDGFISEFYDDKPDLASADDVEVTAPQTTPDIDVALAESGHITGRVTDAVSGDGIPNATVNVFDFATDAFVTSARTDASGNYDVASDLPSGQYKVGFAGPPREFDGSPGYADAFYADKATLAAADPVSVTAPNTTSDIDQELVPCDQVTTTTTGPTTTSLPTTTTSLPVTTTSLSATTTTSPSSTTSLPATTTTTLPGGQACGDPVALTSGIVGAADDVPRVITASDALFVLRTAVGSATCELCICDVNGSGDVTASDALIVLRRAVGQAIELQCPVCAT